MMDDRTKASTRRRVGIVGARGHVGGELIRLLAEHPGFEITFACSREWAGCLIGERVQGVRSELRFADLGPDAVAASGIDALILAVPDGQADVYVAACDLAAPGLVILDLSADHRGHQDWHYGLPELYRARADRPKRIANPGCYATAMQLALAPLRDVLDGPAQCFGVSGYSGAGTTPSLRNDPDRLRDDILPYRLVDHGHEAEVSRHLNHPVEFVPHVAGFFRGLIVTTQAHLVADLSPTALVQRFADFYANEPLVEVVYDPPTPKQAVGRHVALVGGLASAPDRRRVVIVAALDNLLKGAATQALQNLNRAFGFAETAGLDLATAGGDATFENEPVQ